MWILFIVNTWGLKHFGQFFPKLAVCWCNNTTDDAVTTQHLPFSTSNPQVRIHRSSKRFITKHLRSRRLFLSSNSLQHLKAELCFTACIKHALTLAPRSLSASPFSIFLLSYLSLHLFHPLTRTCYLLSHQTHLLSRVNENKSSEQPLSLCLLYKFCCLLLLLSVLTWKKLRSLSAGV